MLSRYKKEKNKELNNYKKAFIRLEYLLSTVDEWTFYYAKQNTYSDIDEKDNYLLIINEKTKEFLSICDEYCLANDVEEFIEIDEKKYDELLDSVKNGKYTSLFDSRV